MRAKHPQENETVPPAEDNITLALSISLRQAISSFKVGSAAGPSGLRGEHLKEARGKGEGRGAAAMAALTKLVNVMARGGVPKEAAPYIFGGNLFKPLQFGVRVRGDGRRWCTLPERQWRRRTPRGSGGSR